MAQAVIKLVEKFKDRKAKREQERKAQDELLKNLKQDVQAQGSQPTVPTETQNPATNPLPE